MVSTFPSASRQESAVELLILFMSCGHQIEDAAVWNTLTYLTPGPYLDLELQLRVDGVHHFGSFHCASSFVTLSDHLFMITQILYFLWIVLLRCIKYKTLTCQRQHAEK